MAEDIGGRALTVHNVALAKPQSVLPLEITQKKLAAPRLQTATKNNIKIHHQGGHSQGRQIRNKLTKCFKDL